MENRQFQEYRISPKYRWSIFIDSMLELVLLVLLMSYFQKQPRPLERVSLILYYVSFFLLFFSYLVSDLFFKNRSIGKILMGIEIRTENQNKKVNFHSIIKRRFMEMLFSPFTGRTIFFLDIDKATATCIVMTRPQRK